MSPRRTVAASPSYSSERCGSRDDEVDGIHRSRGLRDEGVFRADIGDEKGCLFPGEFFQGVSETRFMVRTPAERAHVAVEFGFRGVAAEDEGLAEDEEGVVFPEGIQGDAGWEKRLEKRKAVEDFVEAAGGEGEETVRIAADDPSETAPRGRAGELDDLLIGGVAENSGLTARSDEGELTALLFIEKR